MTYIRIGWHIMLKCLFGRVWTSLGLPLLWICENIFCASARLHYFQPGAAGLLTVIWRPPQTSVQAASSILGSFIICTLTLSLKQVLRTRHKHICFDFCVSNIFSIQMDCMFSFKDYTYKDNDCCWVWQCPRVKPNKGLDST